MRYQLKEATAEAQQTAIDVRCKTLKPLFDSPARIVICHGNGPQIEKPINPTS